MEIMTTGCSLSTYLFLRDNFYLVVTRLRANLGLSAVPEQRYYKPTKGEGLDYSNGMIGALCSPESAANSKNIWMHVVGK